MPPDISEYIRASNGDGEAVRAIVVSEREVGSIEINVDSTLNWPSKFIATSGMIDLSTETFDPDTVTVFFGRKNNNFIEIDGYAPGYADIGHHPNEIIVIKPTTPWSDAVADTVEKSNAAIDALPADIAAEVSSHFPVQKGDIANEAIGTGQLDLNDLMVPSQNVAFTTPTPGKILAVGEIPNSWEVTTSTRKYITGSNITFTVPLGFEWVVLTSEMSMSSSGTSGNRQGVVEIKDALNGGGNLVTRMVPTTSIAYLDGTIVYPYPVVGGQTYSFSLVGATSTAMTMLTIDPTSSPRFFATLA